MVIHARRLSHRDSGRLDAVFSALADRTRRAMLTRLMAGPATVTELAEPFEMSQPAVSKHLRVLERAGLVSRGREAQWRPSRLNAEPLKVATRWLMDYRRFWEGSFDQLDQLLATLKARQPGPDPHRRKCDDAHHHRVQG
ncbi:MAG: ArsR/SmtB family transcription factor [Gemmatimonadales bacterium]